MKTSGGREKKGQRKRGKKLGMVHECQNLEHLRQKITSSGTARAGREERESRVEMEEKEGPSKAVGGWVPQGLEAQVASNPARPHAAVRSGGPGEKSEVRKSLGESQGN